MPESKSARAWAVSLFLFVALWCFAPVAAQHQPQPAQTPTPTAESQPEDAATEIKSYERLEWRRSVRPTWAGATADVEGVPGNPQHRLRCDRFGWAVEDDERRRALDAGLRAAGHDLDRRHRA